MAEGEKELMDATFPQNPALSFFICAQCGFYCGAITARDDRGKKNINSDGTNMRRLGGGEKSRALETLECVGSGNMAEAAGR